eukprot:3933330-Rhodomonas_salina.1
MSGPPWNIAGGEGGGVEGGGDLGVKVSALRCDPAVVGPGYTLGPHAMSVPWVASATNQADSTIRCIKRVV